MAKFLGHAGPIYSVQFTGDLKFLVSGSGDGSIKVWSLESFKEVFSFEHKGLVRNILLIEDEILLSVGGKTLKIWDFSERKLISQLDHASSLISVTVTNDLRFIITGDVKNRIWVWNWDDFELFWVFGSSRDTIKHIEVSKDSNLLAIGESGLVIIWDIEKKTQVGVITKKEKFDPWADVFGDKISEVFQ